MKKIISILIIFLFAYSVHAASLSTYQGEWKASLIAYWALNEGTGTSVAEPINTLTGTIIPVTTDPAWLSTNTGIKPMCKNSATLGSGLTFDGTSGYVNVADNDLLSFGNGTTDSPFSVSCWIKQTTFSSTRTAWAKLDGSGSAKVEYNLLWSASVVYFRVWQTTTISVGRSMPYTSANYNGLWTHIVCTYSGGSTNASAKIYVNGAQADNADAGAGSYTAMANRATPFTIGCQLSSGASNFPFIGSIDEVILWGRVLSAAEISLLYKQGTSAKGFENFNRLLITDGKVPLGMPLSQE